MELGKDEYTISTLIDYLNKRHKNKLSGKEFTRSDVHQYMRRGYLPHRYGSNELECSDQNGVKIIKLKSGKV